MKNVYHHSEETKKKMSESNKGKIISMKTRLEKSKLLKEAYASGKLIPPMKGKHHTEETKRKIRNENSHNWKGDKVGYDALHKWVRKNKPKSNICEMCNNFEPKHLSNVTGEYKRDIDDYQWLCISCHRIYDNQISNII
jgi:hypothetical protein